MIMRNTFLQAVLLIPMLLIHGIAFGQDPTTTVLTSTPTATTYPGTVTLTATVTDVMTLAGACASVSPGTVPLSIVDAGPVGTQTLATLLCPSFTLPNVALPTGTNVITATFNDPNALDNLGASSATITVVVAKATPTLSWAPPAAIAVGTALSSTQLNATASVPGTFAYSPAAGTVLVLGTQKLSVTFTPTDTTDYASASTTVNITVGQASPTITWPTPAAIVYGTALSSTQLNATATAPGTASVPGTFAYSPTAGTVLSAGTQSLSVTFTPTDTTNYASASKSVSITVNLASPTITWPTPAAIPFGTALGSTQLNATASALLNGATANVPGTFAYSPTAGTVPAIGTQSVSVAFTPTDSTDYLPASKTVSITVKQGLPTITWPTPAAIAFGTALGSAQLNATANVPGTFTYSPAAGTVPAIGTQTLSVTFKPTDTVDYSSATGSVILTVGKVQPVVTLQGPSTSASAAQPVLTLGVDSYPVSAVATLTLTFASSTSPAMDDPSVQFASGGRTQTATVPANSKFNVTVPVQTGTVAGTITIKATLTVAGTDVTPSSLVPVAIKLAPSPPVISSVVLTRNGNTLQAEIIGYSNTRELTQAEFQFTGAPGSTLQTPAVTVPESQLFSGWFQNAASDASGSAFLYTEPFTINGDNSGIGSVTVTLTNSLGTSAAVTAQ